jgi:hypothetical protein
MPIVVDSAAGLEAGAESVHSSKASGPMGGGGSSSSRKRSRTTLASSDDTVASSSSGSRSGNGHVPRALALDTSGAKPGRADKRARARSHADHSPDIVVDDGGADDDSMGEDGRSDPVVVADATPADPPKSRAQGRKQRPLVVRERVRTSTRPPPDVVHLTDDNDGDDDSGSNDAELTPSKPKPFVLTLSDLEGTTAGRGRARGKGQDRQDRQNHSAEPRGSTNLGARGQHRQQRRRQQQQQQQQQQQRPEISTKLARALVFVVKTIEGSSLSGFDIGRICDSYHEDTTRSDSAESSENSEMSGPGSRPRRRLNVPGLRKLLVNQGLVVAKTIDTDAAQLTGGKSGALAKILFKSNCVECTQCTMLYRENSSCSMCSQ